MVPASEARMQNTWDMSVLKMGHQDSLTLVRRRVSLHLHSGDMPFEDRK